MAETQETMTAEQMTQHRIDGYRAAAAGEVDIHLYESGDGEVVKEVLVPHGDPEPNHRTELHHIAYVVPGVHYVGLMPKEAATELADSLEGQLARNREMEQFGLDPSNPEHVAEWEQQGRELDGAGEVDYERDAFEFGSTTDDSGQS